MPDVVTLPQLMCALIQSEGAESSDWFDIHATPHVFPRHSPALRATGRHDDDSHAPRPAMGWRFYKEIDMGNKGAAIICLVLATTVAEAMRFTEWSPAVSAEAVWGTDETFNTPFQDGCPAPSKDGVSIYMESNRPGGHGGDS